MDETRLNVLGLQPRIAFANGLRRVTGGKHSQDVLDGKPMPANNRLSGKDPRIDADALKKLLLIHRSGTLIRTERLRLRQLLMVNGKLARKRWDIAQESLVYDVDIDSLDVAREFVQQVLLNRMA